MISAKTDLHTHAGHFAPILTYNRDRTPGLADGIVITPSHNPPEDGGFKYNPPMEVRPGSEITRRHSDQGK